MTVICPYYPYHPYEPGSYPAFNATCSDYCCPGNAVSSSRACCYSTPAPETSSTSLWWISVIVIGIVLITAGVVVVYCVYFYKKPRQTNPTEMIAWHRNPQHPTNYQAPAQYSTSMEQNNQQYHSKNTKNKNKFYNSYSLFHLLNHYESLRLILSH